MKPLSLVLFIIAIASVTDGYTQESLRTQPLNIHQFSSEQEARKIIDRITSAVGLKPNFEIKAGDVDNAAALVHKGKRYIIYNPVFVRQISKAVNTDWAGISILAHEIGHHLNGHTLTSTGSLPSLELEADEFSGFVLKRMGASLTEAQAAMRVISSERASATHPDQSSRLASIQRGWLQAEDQLASKGASPASGTVRSEEPDSNTEKEATSYIFPPKYIAGKVYLNGHAGKKIILTTQANVVLLKPDGYNIIGRLVKSSDSVYLALSDNMYFQVTPGGAIVDRSKKKIGYIKRA